MWPRTLDDGQEFWAHGRVPRRRQWHEHNRCEAVLSDPPNVRRFRQALFWAYLGVLQWRARRVYRGRLQRRDHTAPVLRPAARLSAVPTRESAPELHTRLRLSLRHSALEPASGTSRAQGGVLHALRGGDGGARGRSATATCLKNAGQAFALEGLRRQARRDLGGAESQCRGPVPKKGAPRLDSSPRAAVPVYLASIGG